MDRAAALARLNRRMLERFSAGTIDALRAALPMRLALPHLEPFLARNLEKEARKDALVVRCARDALATGAPPAAGAASTLLAAARDIDREFLASVARFPVRIEVPYGRIEPLRLRRIQLGLALSWRILHAWQAGRRLRDAIPGSELARQLREILRLYCEETAALSHGVRMPALLAPLRERVARLLLQTMQQAAERLAQDIAAQKRR
jgi:hypothetical protein